MKIIFLDIDGVLATRFRERDEFGHLFDPKTVAALRKIIYFTDAKIVVSSTWRISGFEVMKELWEHRQLPGEVIDVTGITHHGFRGLEIRTWLNQQITYKTKEVIQDGTRYVEPDEKIDLVDSYVIIDDDSDMLLRQRNQFVQTNAQIGLTEADAIRAIKILNNPPRDWKDDTKL